MTLGLRMQTPEHFLTRGTLVRYGRPAEAPLWAPPEQTPDFLDNLRKLWRHRFLVLGCTLLFAAASVAAIWFLPTRYFAAANVRVGVPDIPIFAHEPRVDPGGTTNERVENERIVMLSRGLMAQVADKLNLAQNPEFNPMVAPSSGWHDYLNPVHDIGRVTRGVRAWIGEKADAPPDSAPAQTQDQLVDAVLGHFDVSTLGHSQVLSVQAWSADPKTAASLANTLSDVYLAYQKGQKTADSSRIENYLAGRITELRAQVGKSETAVAEYRQKYGLYQGASASVTSQQLTELNTQLTEAQTAKAEAESRLREIATLKAKGGNNESLPDVLNSPVVQALRAQQADAERKMAELSASYGPRHPKIIDARAAIEDVRAKIQAETNRIIDGLRHQAGNADARYQALQANFDKAKTQAGGVNAQSVELQALEREATVNSNLLDAMLNRAKETFGREEIEQPDAKLISTASPPQKASYPPKFLILFLGTAAGVLLGALAALLFESADRTFRRADEVERVTGLPVLSLVPSVRRATPPALHILHQPVSTYSEALRKIYVGLQLSVKGEPPRTILFTSSTPSEGKSVMAASFARMLARNGKRVLLVDCDWRNPTLHRLFQCSNRYGLAQVMSEERGSLKAAIFHDAASGLDVLVSGGWTPRSSELLMSDRLGAMLRVFAKNYDLVILDSPPVLVSSEVLVLSRLVDKTVFVIRWGNTSRESAFDALRQLVDAQADIAGAVLSRVDAKRYREFAYSHLNYDYGADSVVRIA
jgi:polysaccharide biosynthesis transport protein